MDILKCLLVIFQTDVLIALNQAFAEIGYRPMRPISQPTEAQNSFFCFNRLLSSLTMIDRFLDNYHLNAGSKDSEDSSSYGYLIFMRVALLPTICRDS